MPSAPSAEELKVSVIVPVFDGERHLEDALDSVAGQTYPAFELIVVDDASSDRSADLARAHAAVTLVVCRETRGGPGAARNDGVARACGTHIAFLDADDYWAENKLERQVRALEANPDASIAGCLISEFHDPELSDTEKQTMPLRSAVAALPSTMLIKKEAFDRVGGFVADGGTGTETLEWGLAVQEAGLIVVSVHDAVAFRRLHATNTSRVRRASQRHGYLAALKKSLDRRRATEDK
jgi:glycosyltransferase involved in cell wall biosynthesis